MSERAPLDDAAPAPVATSYVSVVACALFLMCLSVGGCRYVPSAPPPSNAAREYNLGLRHLYGQGVDQNDRLAAWYFQLAAAQNYANAQNSLGYLYLHGRGVQQDYSRAMSLFLAAARAHNGNAEASLGFMYSQGLGVAVDNAAAMNWYLRSSADGNRHGSASLGRIYAEGRGVVRDLGKAQEWMQKAAEEGDSDAQNWLSYTSAGAQQEQWRADQIKLAEQRLRKEVGDPGATFDKEQLTGDEMTGQTCGRIRTRKGGPVRFIVYIDVAAPYVERGFGHTKLTQAQFDNAWMNDCLGEGYDVQ